MSKLFKNIGNLVEGNSYKEFLIFKAGSYLGAAYAIYTLETENTWILGMDAPEYGTAEFQKGFTPEVTVEPLAESVLNQIPSEVMTHATRNGAFTKKQALEIVQYLEERWEGKPQEERELSHKKPEYGGNKNLYWEVA
jgi:hypothetical protein